MAYTYQGARALRYGVNAQWQDVNLSTMLVIDIFATYRRIVLSLDKAGTTVYVDMEQLRSQYAAYRNYIPVLLMSIGARQLDELPSLPGGKIDYIQYTDAYRVGYSVNRGKAGMNLPSGYPTMDLPDLILTRPGYGTDMSLLHTYCLTSVNGFFHNTDSDGTNTWVIDGGKSVQTLNQGHVGLTSFMDIGKLTKLKIDLSTVVPAVDQTALKDGLTFSVPQSTDGKSFFLVLGGYLVMPKDGVFFQTGDNSYRLNLQALPYLERIMESNLSMDLSGLGLATSELNPTLVNIDQVFSDTVVKNYLGLSQTFFVIVDRAELFTNPVMIRPMKVPGVFTSYQEPTLPLVVGYGRTAEYWKVDEGEDWAVTIIDNFLRRYVFDLQQQSDLVNVTNALESQQPYFLSQGLLLELGAYAS